MKIIIFFSILVFLFVFSTNQISFGDIEGEENRKEAAKKAADALKRENTRSESEENFVDKEKKDSKEVKKKLGKLKKFLLSEKEFDEITLSTVWRYVDKQSEKNEEHSLEMIQGLVRDIGRVYDPVVNKYKVATIQIEIIKFEDLEKLKTYWQDKKNSSLDNLYHNAYLIGSINETTNCMFNYSNEGAITICKTDEFIVQSIIYDKYQEHYTYAKPQTGIEKLELNQKEITTRIVEEIIKKILDTEIEDNNELHKILKSNKDMREKEINQKEKSKEEITEQNRFVKEKNENKLLGIEKDRKYGIQNFYCLKDEFGLITISGQYNNNHIKKDKVEMNILFLDNEKNILFKNTANLLEIDKFETKRFLGNLKTNESFSACIVQITN